MQKPCKFLVIDDNEIDRMVTSTLLRYQGITNITTAESGPVALDWIEQHHDELAPCLIILLDIKMPGMDGFEFLSKFEGLDDDMKRVTRVFMLSSSIDPHDIERAESHVSVNGMLTKPLPKTGFVTKLS